MAKQLEKMDKWDPKWHAMHKIWWGIGLFLFGFLLWVTNSNWPVAFMIMGILIVLKGIWMLSKK